MGVLYNTVIQPLVFVYDVLYSLLYRLIKEPMPAILALSVVVNFLVLPLYQKADRMQQEEMQKAKRMKPALDHIRRTFRGDERFLMQSAYYRIEHYNPLNVLKEAGPLALQIPFFIAAYRFISGISMLENAAFGPIPNLMAPDGLLRIGGAAVNVLPILMTAINLVSGAVYAKGGPVRQKVQIYATAAIFLVLLYNSPAGLVIYWIMNQIFSLLKNLASGRELRHKALWKAGAAAVILLWLAYALHRGIVFSETEVFVARCLVIVCAAVIVSAAIRERIVKLPAFLRKTGGVLASVQGECSVSQLLLVEVCLAALMGLFIPTSVLASSAVEFVDPATGAFPYELIRYPALIYAGLLVLWTSVLILSRDGKKRFRLSLGLWIFLGVALVNQFFFDPKVGILYSSLIFDGEIQTGGLRGILNVLVCLAVAGVFLWVFRRKPAWVKLFSGIAAAALVLLSAANVRTIRDQTADLSPRETQAEAPAETLHLSRNGRNVIVFMLDRAVSGYLPYILEEQPELKEQLRGFVYYPDTLSFGLCTNYAAPALFGGYEYTPAEMNRRDGELLKDKHNEALKVMPVLFSENGFRVTVCDLPYGNYQIPTDLSFFDEYPDIEVCRLEGAFTMPFHNVIRAAALDQQRNFVVYSLFRTVPLYLKSIVYDGGGYLSARSKSPYSNVFLDSYSALAALPDVTAGVDDGEDHCLILQNETPHEDVSLNPPDYAVDGKAAENRSCELTADGNTLTVKKDEWGHYCTNVAAYRALGQWLDHLRREGVYDNTRIILVSDHGYKYGQFDALLGDGGLDVESFWPLLMVKDFGAAGDFAVSTEFMTNADCPALAARGLIENPVNPFTGKPLDSAMKSGVLYVTDSWKWSPSKNNGTVFDTEGDHWWTAHDSIFDLNNWTPVEKGGE